MINRIILLLFIGLASKSILLGYCKGDINQDNDISMSDIMKCKNMILYNDTSYNESILSDLNSDGKTDIFDLIQISDINGGDDYDCIDLFTTEYNESECFNFGSYTIPYKFNNEGEIFSQSCPNVLVKMSSTLEDTLWTFNNYFENGGNGLLKIFPDNNGGVGIFPHETLLASSYYFKYFDVNGNMIFDYNLGDISFNGDGIEGYHFDVIFFDDRIKIFHRQNGLIWKILNLTYTGELITENGFYNPLKFYRGISNNYYVKTSFSPLIISKYDIDDEEIFQTSIPLSDVDISPTDDGGFCFLYGYTEIYKYDEDGNAEIIIELDDCNNDNSICFNDFDGTNISVELFSPIKKLDGGRYHYSVSFYDWFYEFTEIIDVFLDENFDTIHFSQFGLNIINTNNNLNFENIKETNDFGILYHYRNYQESGIVIKTDYLGNKLHPND